MYNIVATFAEAIKAIMETLSSNFDQIELFGLQWQFKPRVMEIRLYEGCERHQDVTPEVMG